MTLRSANDVQLKLFAGDEGPDRGVAYFSGPLTWYAKTQDPRLGIVRRIGDTVEKTLTHAGFRVYVPHQQYDDPKGRHRYIHNREAISNSNLVVAYYDYPSTGLGQELEISTEFGVPVLLLVNERRDNISTMISSSFMNFKILLFDDNEDIARQLSILAIQNANVAARRAVDEHASIASMVRSYRRDAGLTQAELAHRLGMSKHYVAALEDDPAAANPTLVHLVTLSQELGIKLPLLLGAMQKVQPIERIVRIASQSDRSARDVAEVIGFAARDASREDLSDSDIRALFRALDSLK